MSKYRTIAEDLRRRIVAGRLVPGDPIPSDSQLARRWGVAQGTARQAVAVLRQEGLIVTEHGRGSFVRGAEVSAPVPVLLARLASLLESARLAVRHELDGTENESAHYIELAQELLGTIRKEV